MTAFCHAGCRDKTTNPRLMHTAAPSPHCQGHLCLGNVKFMSRRSLSWPDSTGDVPIEAGGGAAVTRLVAVFPDLGAGPESPGAAGAIAGLVAVPVGCANGLLCCFAVAYVGKAVDDRSARSCC